MIHRHLWHCWNGPKIAHQVQTAWPANLQQFNSEKQTCLTRCTNATVLSVSSKRKTREYFEINYLIFQGETIIKFECSASLCPVCACVCVWLKLMWWWRHPYGVSVAPGGNCLTWRQTTWTHTSAQRRGEDGSLGPLVVEMERQRGMAGELEGKRNFRKVMTHGGQEDRRTTTRARW